MRRQIATCLLVIALGLIALVFFWPDRQEEDGETAALQQLLNLKLVDTNQTTIDLAAWRGRVRVINLWATWCAPCKEEMPAFSRLQDEFQGKNAQFVGIALDSPENVRLFFAKHPVSYPLLIGDEHVLALSRALGNPYMSLPFTLVVDEEDKIQARKAGRLDAESLMALLRRLTEKRGKLSADI
ncbi:MAG: TlpA family protein disulfide reductase [Zoogloeaceae bacterium]|jgi:peroxiredoxin|nr:TlpA family protein disulfide reductase [Zoogloeaceae bacterium]